MSIVDFEKFKNSKNGTEYKEKLSKMDALDLLEETIPLAKLIRRGATLSQEERLKAKILFEEMALRYPDGDIPEAVKKLMAYLGLDKD